MAWSIPQWGYTYLEAHVGYQGVAALAALHPSEFGHFHYDHLLLSCLTALWTISFCWRAWASSLLTRSSIGGWVEKRFAGLAPLSGFTMNIWDVAGVASSIDAR